MAKLSDLIISNPEVTTFPQLEILVAHAAEAGHMFIEMDLKPDYRDTPRKWSGFWKPHSPKEPPMTDETVTDKAEITLPFSKRVVVREVQFASGMKMTRLVFFEGKRVTQIDLDAPTATQLATALLPTSQA